MYVFKPIWNFQAKKISMKFLKFLVSKTFLKNLAFAIIGFWLLLVLSFGFLKVYTHHGEALSVPDLTGMDMGEVQKVLKKNKLQYKVIDSIFIYDRRKGTVISQNPIPNSKVKRKRTIHLTMNALKPMQIPMAKVNGTSLRQAMALLESRDFRVGRLYYENDFAQNNVLEQKYQGNVIDSGTMIEKGSYIDLVVGKGLKNFYVVVPEVRNLNKNIALKKLITGCLNMGTINYDNSVLTYNDSVTARVWKQSPKFISARKLRLGSFVDVWFTKDSVKIAELDSLLISN